ncbi:UDP-N-acetylmuramoylalanyl-D-glutamate-L- lysine ligase [Enterococcus sp. 10A9_DIV0425]|uniref:UDP-N-acetylmuramoyl-L-alanyl-D-glutamate--L-lysine ligase n=1 Tax=Candidatus Enterococcus wittei TaxID=1987383 RepID=A0A242JVA6_9ENTE|nr:UDP-N-acetylmuramoyl-L-alanyl-D-glutamate--L-lysine ligase [Enterococcus sp. 10A9_DIV0425]OTP06835.1 UDP-N-acetylmuramoylalanyl-D-glutamate-L- lysine ligase [Enterococcus sp. 10A9_DIV0425]
MRFSLEDIRNLLLKENLLKEFVSPKGWHLYPPATVEFSQLSYDSREVDAHTLFFCKGLNFKEEYLNSAISNGLAYYVAEVPYENEACGIIVTDIRKAMAILSMAFYDYPQNKLKVIGFTGTKGKTTAAYFTKAILDHATAQKTALLSTMNTTLDGKTFFKSKLTTPESLDLYRMMAEAVQNKMTHLVMEVSSQAYKTQRVYGLTLDVGIFLNISPDHISPIEHPTFDDYFYCKRQLILNSKKVILNHESDYADLLMETAKVFDIPAITYGRSEQSDIQVKSSAKQSQVFQLINHRHSDLTIEANYEIKLAGGFNEENATSAIIAAALVGASIEDAQHGLKEARVPGRMDQLTHKNGAHVYVDYAHNYLSLKTLLTFAKNEHPNGRVIVVLGSPGNKAISRRQDFGRVLSETADVVFLTADDPAFEDPQKIAKEIHSAITNQELTVYYEMDRPTAIQLALSESQPEDSVVIAGKGVDAYQKVGGVDEPYEGDYDIAKRLTTE